MNERAKKQVDRMFSGMTAQERAVHIIQAWKADTDEEPLVRSTAPREQARELNELLDLTRCVNRDLGMIVFLYEQTARSLQYRCAWLQTLRAWAMHSQSLAHHLLLLVPEPVTESDAAQRVHEMRETRFSLDEAAAYLADSHEEEEDDEWVWKKRLKAAVDAGELRAVRQGRTLSLAYGDVADWEGYEITAFPEWGYEIEILPDDQAKRVEKRRDHLEDARRALGRSPTYLATFEPPSDALPEDAEGASRIAYALVVTLKSELTEHWRDIRALEDCIEEVQERLGGEDPADPMVRDALENAKGIIETAVSQLGEMQIPIELPEPDDDARAPVHRLLDQAVGRDANW
jgi:hypothetical protein